MKILWVIDGREMYGEKRAIGSLMLGIRDSGWEAQGVSLTRGECMDALASLRLPVDCLDIGHSPGLQLVSGKAAKLRQACRLFAHQFDVGPRIRAAIRRHDPDVVHVLNKNILPAVGWAAARERRPCFWEMTAVVGSGYPLDFNRRLHWELFRWLKIRPLANSRYTADTLASPAFKVDVMYLGADPAQFDPHRTCSVTRAALKLPENAAVFAIIARVDQSKGQRRFLEGMLMGDPGPQLLLVGADPRSDEVARIRDMAAGAGRQAYLHIVDASNHPESYLAVADVVVNARVDAEPFGLSTVEGMLMGKPALVHALGGPAETVVDGETGWHVPEPTPAAFHAGIQRALADRARWPEMGLAARKRAETLFSLPAQTRRYREFVAAALEARGR